MRKEGATRFEKENSFEGDHWIVDSRPEKAADVGEAVEARLKALGWTSEEIQQFPLAVTEIVQNAIIHGNLGFEKENYPSEDEYKKAIEEFINSGKEVPQKVVIDLNITDEKVEVIVSDEGGKLIDRKKIPTPEEILMNQSGRGLRIVIENCSDINFSPGKVIMRKMRYSDTEMIR